MSRSIKQLYGKKLEASDGEIGHVKSFYFDDQSWAVRYVVAETGTWLTSRQVLLSPHVLGNAYLAGKVLAVNLTRKQIEDSPSLEWHKPVSRQYEEEYYRHYGWPNYWQGDGLWGMSGFPILSVLPKTLPREETAASNPKHERNDAHLRSTQAVKGYHIQDNDGIIGHVCDFMIDDRNWAIGQLVVKTGHRFSGNEVQIPTSKIERISYEESTVFVNLTRKTIEQGPALPLAPVSAQINVAQSRPSERTTLAAGS
jgi:sporulation protein YlmC with PRC-barrel domain